jgi:hypothetical protein
MATTRGLVGIFAGRSVNLVVLQSVNKFPCRYFHKCVECGRIYSSTFTTIGVLKNIETATQRKSCVCGTRSTCTPWIIFAYSEVRLGFVLC